MSKADRSDAGSRRWALARALGIIGSYIDQSGTRRRMRAATRDALLAGMGIDAGDTAQVDTALTAATAPRTLPHWQVVLPDTPPPLTPPGDWILTDEDGATHEGRGALPPLPLGRNRLEAGGEVCWLLASPAALPLPDRGWGITVPLYGLRGRDRGGLADYRDLAETASALGRAGAGFLGLNPVHAGFSGDPQAISPYSPSHRRRLATSHVFVAGEAATEAGELIDYPQALAARRPALEAAYAAEGEGPEFTAYLAEEGPSLTRFATYEALAEVHGPYWSDWPEALQRPTSDAVGAFARAHPDRIRFHAWLQFQAETQLAEAARAASAAGMAHGLYLDLAVGTHPAGAETWAEPDCFAFGVSLGAPPDAFSPDGQRWMLAPFDPNALIREGFRPLADTLRRQLRHARLLRIDHILGFERAYWAPEGGVPGGYVRMPREAMLAVARIEAARVGATIVGEDLGNIPGGLQAALARSGILGCRVAMFENGKPAESYDEAVLASFGTHDLPTFLGWRAGADIALRQTLGDIDAAAATQARADRAKDVAGLGVDGVDALNAFLARTPARLVALQIEDLLEVADQPNLPGTTNEYPNWRRTLPAAGASLEHDPRITRAASLMARAGR